MSRLSPLSTLRSPWPMLLSIGTFGAAILVVVLVTGPPGSQRSRPLSCGGLVATIVGTDGDDVIDGGPGDDRAIGGPGDDACIHEETSDCEYDEPPPNVIPEPGTSS